MTQDLVRLALAVIPVAELTELEWVQIGMALKLEGYPLSVWQEWSRNDSRYHEEEFPSRWESFKGSTTPVTKGTIFHIAKRYGFHMPKSSNQNVEISNEELLNVGEKSRKFLPLQNMSPYAQIICCLQQLFEPNDYVGYVVKTHQKADGKHVPGKAQCARRMQELVDSLEKHPGDICYTFGDYNPVAGAFLVINALDGNGSKNENVSRFKVALVESDKLSLEEQERLYRQLQLPIVCLTYSGNKSLHALVRVDATTKEEYEKRVAYLYQKLLPYGIDGQNKNPARLSRFPGFQRDTKQQTLVAINIGKPDWISWYTAVENQSITFPPIPSSNKESANSDKNILRLCTLKQAIQLPFSLPPILIDGILRCGHKLLLAGPSKAGKSFLLMELCIAIAEGRKWLEFQ